MIRCAPLALALSIAAAGVSAAEQTSPPRPFKLRSGAWNERYVYTHVLSASIPFRKRYDELTAGQKARVHADYEAMGPLDEPPFPANGLQAVFDPLLQARERLRFSGNLTLVVDVDAQGQAQSIQVHESPGPEITQFAAGVLLITKYKPARCGGEPCAQQYLLRAAFEDR